MYKQISKIDLENIAYKIIDIVGHAYKKRDSFEINIYDEECMVSFECESHPKIEQYESYDHPAIESTVYHINTCVVHRLYTTEALDVTDKVNSIINK